MYARGIYSAPQEVSVMLGGAQLSQYATVLYFKSQANLANLFGYSHVKTTSMLPVMDFPVPRARLEDSNGYLTAQHPLLFMNARFVQLQNIIALHPQLQSPQFQRVRQIHAFPVAGRPWLQPDLDRVPPAAQEKSPMRTEVGAFPVTSENLPPVRDVLLALLDLSETQTMCFF